MSSQFWRFGNTYNESSAINALLENAFLDKDATSRSQSPHTKNKSFGFNQYTDDDDDDDDDDEDNDDDRNEHSIPNLEILAKLLDENEILEELLGSNIKLIQYLRTRHVLSQLVRYVMTCDDLKQFMHDNENDEAIIQEQEKEDHDKQSSTTESSSDLNNEDEETPEETHARRSQVAAEILSAEAWSLTDTLMENLDLLSALWSILDFPAPLSMTLSTHFMKINEHLLDSKTDEMLNFLLHQDNIADRFLRHIDNPPLMDFLLKVISTDKPDNSSGIIDLLKDQDIITKLIAFLRPEVSSSMQSAAGDFIKALITISANSNTDNTTVGPNELTRDLVSESTMEELSDLMLNGGTSLANGVGIIIEIIRKNNSDYDYVPVLYTTLESHPPNSRDPIYLGHLIKVFSKKIPQFAAILEDTKLPNLETPFGAIEPLGFERFKICELIAELLHCSNMGLLNDEAGEAIVRQRDLERIRVIELAKLEILREQQRMQGQDISLIEDEDDVSRDINRLSISSDSGSDVFQESSEHPQREDITQEDIDIALESTNFEDSTDRDTLKDKEEGEQLKNADDEAEAETETSTTHNNVLESEPDSDPEGSNVELEFDVNEPVLRKQAIAGDQLKIALIDNKVIIKILNMFFRFPWNNFLHNVVFDIVQQILNGSMEIGYNKYLAIDLFGRGEITKLIVDGQKKCEEYETETGLRLGYMGHLTLIAEEVVKFITVYPPVSIHPIIVSAVSTEDWAFYHNQTLVETREKYNALLGGDGEENDENDDDDYDEEERRGLELDPSVDHDITGSGYEDEQDDDQVEDHDDAEMSDKFSRYMSQQINDDIPNKSSSEDEDEDEEGELSQEEHNQQDDDENDLVGWNNQQYHQSHDQYQMAHEDDDYEDPNDDGQSYTKKSHPLYNEMLSLNTNPQEQVDDDGSSSSSDSEDDETFNDEGSEGGSEGYKLTRNKSKGEMNWDDDEQNRLLNMANYIKTHSRSGSNSPEHEK